MSECINLRDNFGSKYQITFDPVYDAKGKWEATLDPWYMQIPCKRGVIYPYGGTRLAIEVDHRAATARRIAALPCCHLMQDGDREKTFTFDVIDFEIVAEIVQPRRKRRMTEERRQACAGHLARIRQTPLVQSIIS